MHASMTASSTAVRSMRIWMHARYALYYGIRSGEMTLVMLRASRAPKKRAPAKVMWYAPIIPRLKRLFQNKEHAKLLRLHKEDRKKRRDAETPR